MDDRRQTAAARSKNDIFTSKVDLPGDTVTADRVSRDGERVRRRR